ncbi:TetR/AcrR family transcriptional regulator C-terminal domain-containing protein [Pseudomonas brenneri]|uniref:DNA-binding transcriptional regulator, AcrR family n=1 Tax=Pseudomonas brenneri TaxID=129817 RepID=A0A5B2V6S8_9PSED|nr:MULTISPECIES: TetR/AcrR family transcriptional regulator [Pseudomonas fluorescens group]KAA2233919.1 TetR/AcrR family transcriptional regulator [Pseudomonas brenneri]MBF8005675.1 TetR/AcrR family transcriptional regulator C-terminal domain-containing protein [Pseudomonas brenneri]TWR81847.1 TetR/AcrR family transcriptional regulator [Pseudomonas brenneri]WJM89146.1 TetR/AcrR family transcriptional regulator [Pseudomonas brenneri]SDU95240.1 DNA-binding transcriptional regulator, AcrR family 
MQTPTPRQAAKRQSILQVATDMFLAEGYSGVSVDGIIANIGGSKRTLYAYFGGKEGLFAAIIEQLCAENVSPLTHMTLAQKPLDEALKTIARVFLDVVLSPRTLALHRLIVSEALRAPEAAKSFFEAAPATAYSCLADYFTWAEEAGLVIPGNPQTRAKIFLDALTGDMQLRCLLGLSPCPGKAAREHLISETTAIFINGLSTDRH